MWHDLGTNYFYQSKTSTSESEKIDFSKKAFICFQKAISMCPNYEPHWSALGVVTLGDGKVIYLINILFYNFHRYFLLVIKMEKAICFYFLSFRAERHGFWTTSSHQILTN